MDHWTIGEDEKQWMKDWDTIYKEHKKTKIWCIGNPPYYQFVNRIPSWCIYKLEQTLIKQAL